MANHATPTGSLRRASFALLCACVFVNAGAQLLPVPESDDIRIGYRTVADALAALRLRPEVQITEQEGWIIAADKSAFTFWSFAPQAHPAYPAVVKRRVIEKNGSVFIEMDVLCQAKKDPCDALVREFQQLNDKMRSSMQHPTP